MAEKYMRQDYPVQDNEYRRGISAVRHTLLLISRAKKTGIAQNLNHRNSQIARFIITAGRVTAVLQPAFLSKLLGEIRNAGRRTTALATERDAIADEAGRLSTKLSSHRQLSADIAESKRIAIANLRKLGKGFTYRCRDCHLYFTSKNPGARCRWCKSSDSVRVQL